MKTIEQIEEDCDLNLYQRSALERHLSEEENNAHNAILTPLVRKLYGRITELEEGETAKSQMSLNFTWLMGMMDRAHAAMCSPHLGTWQQRAERVVALAEEDANR